MASSKDPKLMIKDRDGGHDVFFFIPVRTIVNLKSEPFMVEYNIDCQDLSTSWRLGIVYKHKPETGKVTCRVTLIRTDSKNGCLNVFVFASYLDVNGRSVCYPKPIGNGQILAGDKIRGSVKEYRHPGYRSYIFSLGLVLGVSILIQNCHPRPNLDAKAGLRTVEQEMHRSKL